MAVYRLSRKAATDLNGIYEYTIVNFGLAQAQNYLNGLHDCCGNLARQPTLGRQANQLAPELRRYEHRSHVVFYVLEEDSVTIVRVLHKSMDARRHL